MLASGPEAGMPAPLLLRLSVFVPGLIAAAILFFKHQFHSLAPKFEDQRLLAAIKGQLVRAVLSVVLVEERQVIAVDRVAASASIGLTFEVHLLDEALIAPESERSATLLGMGSTVEAGMVCRETVRGRNFGIFPAVGILKQ